MNGLFRRLFIMIWLCIAGTIGLILLLTRFSGATLPAEEKYPTTSALALDLIATLVETDHLDAARTVAAALEDISSSHPEIAEIPAGSAHCETGGTKDSQTTRFVTGEGGCYKITVRQSDSFYRIFKYIFFPFLTCLVASLLASFWLAKYLTHPIVTLKNGLHRLAGGDFTTRIGSRFTKQRDEVSDLAHDFDVTAAKLEALQATRQRLYHDISHELRSPLSRLQVELGVLRQKPEKVDTMLLRMNREIERLNTLVEQILTLARLGSGSHIPVERQRIDVIELLDAIVEDASFEGQRRNVEVRLDGQKEFIAEVDGELLYRAFENVIRNALKYTAEGTMVRVYASLEGEHLLKVSVKDCGPGVPPGYLTEIFDPFVRLNDPPLIGGHGLGLAIARHSLELHGGRIWAEAPNEGGLTVNMEIPAFASTPRHRP
ncbi:two-component sensor histidine kinase [Brucella endophytica]|uniref:histidine kinase n=1 Tax=Brucella endophytica TaxID=1963359 RepID=A0A916WBK7_9HYPH|nr:HAMP domain-containing sensor histidine kinase [Brucella endophytica]GGA83267.1 two-component sensor histidine kinase [Brucella endophytica]